MSLAALFASCAAMQGGVKGARTWKGFLQGVLSFIPHPSSLCHHRGQRTSCVTGTLLRPAGLPPALLPVASPLLVSEHCWVFQYRQVFCNHQLAPVSLGQFLVPPASVRVGHLLHRPSLGPTGTGLCQWEGEV